MPKGYWVASVTVTDPEGYKEYLALNAEPLARYGAKFLVRGGPSETMIGEWGTRTVVIEFASVEDAKACFESEAYQQALAVRLKHSTSNHIIVAGFDAVEPSAAASPVSGAQPRE